MANRCRAASSFSPPRLTKRGGGPTSSMGSPAATSRDGLSATEPDTSTCPCSMRATAWGRVATSPRSTRARSSRRRGELVSPPTRCRRPASPAPSWPAPSWPGPSWLAFGGRRLLGRRLLRRRLLGRGLLGRRLLGRGLLRRQPSWPEPSWPRPSWPSPAFACRARGGPAGVGGPADQGGHLLGQVLEVGDAHAVQLVGHLAGAPGRRTPPGPCGCARCSSSTLARASLLWNSPLCTSSCTSSSALARVMLVKAMPASRYFWNPSLLTIALTLPAQSVAGRCGSDPVTQAGVRPARRSPGPGRPTGTSKCSDPGGVTPESTRPKGMPSRWASRPSVPGWSPIITTDAVAVGEPERDLHQGGHRLGGACRRSPG